VKDELLFSRKGFMNFVQVINDRVGDFDQLVSLLLEIFLCGLMVLQKNFLVVSVSFRNLQVESSLYQYLSLLLKLFTQRIDESLKQDQNK
jgi:hypothetical protein